MNANEPLSAALLGLALSLRQWQIVGQALERHLGAESDLVKRVFEAHQLGAASYEGLCIELGNLHLLSEEAPGAAKPTLQ